MCCVRGYHVYKNIWDASIGEELVCRREPSNGIGGYEVAVIKDDVVVGHLLKKMACIYSLFLLHVADNERLLLTAITAVLASSIAAKDTDDDSCLERLGS